MSHRIYLKPFTFKLNRKLETSRSFILKKKGWLLHLTNESGQSGWGEISPINDSELNNCQKILEGLDSNLSRENLEEVINNSPPSLAFGIGGALAESDCIIGDLSSNGWLKPKSSAFLLSGKRSIIDDIESAKSQIKSIDKPLTFKWKVGIKSLAEEKDLLRNILDKLPTTARLRLDANGGWSRDTAEDWIELISNESRIEWLEQPLTAKDVQGHIDLSKKISIALDESLIENPSLRTEWLGWQIRRPSIEGDPRILLKELNQETKFRAISTSFETGIGMRWINHFAALQQKGSTPTAPGLAPGWFPNSPLFSINPLKVWNAA